MTGKARSNDEDFIAKQLTSNAKFETFMSQNSNIDHGQFLTNPQPEFDINKFLQLGRPNVIGGVIGYTASIIPIVSGAIDIGLDSSKLSSHVIVQAETGTVDTLSSINNFVISYEDITIQADTGDVITVDDTDNIFLGDGVTSIVLNSNEQLRLRYDIRANKWSVFIGSAGDVINPPFIDSDPLVKGSADPTKLMRFEIDGFTTSTTRVMTLPNASVTLAGLGVVSQTWSGINIFTSDVSVRTAGFFIQNSADITKQLNFALAGATTGQVVTIASNHTANRTITLPNGTTTLGGLGITSQTWTGENIFTASISVRDTNFFVQNTADITKQMLFDFAGATTGQTLTLESNHTAFRTVTFPDATTVLAGLSVTQSWTGANTFVGDVAVRTAQFFIQNTSDITKQLNFLLAGATTGQVMSIESNHTANRTVTLPDSTTTLAGLSINQTFTADNIFTDVALRSGGFFIQNTTDITKQLNFLLAGATTGQVMSLQSNHTGNRTLTLPDATTDLAGLGVVSQTWTGTNTYAGPSIFNGNITLGSDSADTITFNGDTVGNITPNVDDTDDLGAPTQAMNFIYVKSGHAIIEGYATGFRPGNQTNTAILFTVPTAGGLTELRVVFQTGGSIIIETEV